MRRAGVAVLGPGHLGMELIHRLRDCDELELKLVAGLPRDAEALRELAAEGAAVSDQGIEALIQSADAYELVLDATTAAAYREHAPRLTALGKKLVNLTPEDRGVAIVPELNLAALGDASEATIISCGAQATLPIIAAVSGVCPVEYAETIVCGSSANAGQGFCDNLDEYVLSTGKAIRALGGANRGKCVVINNPAQPPLNMHATLFVQLERMEPALDEKIKRELAETERKMRREVAGYRLSMAPLFDPERRLLTVMVEVLGAEGRADTGNLAISAHAALRIAAAMARRA